MHKTFLKLEYVVKFIQKPAVDTCHLPNLFDAIPTMESSRNCEDAFICWIDKFFVDVFHEVVLNHFRKATILVMDT